MEEEKCQQMVHIGTLMAWRGGAGVLSSSYLLGLGPLLLGQDLVLVAVLDGAADAEDAVVALLGRETLEGEADLFPLLLEEVVVPG